MTLYQYLSQNQVEKAQFARDLGIAESSLFKYINQEREPKLSIAIKIVELTEGKVTYRGLLRDETEADLPISDSVVKPLKRRAVKQSKKVKKPTIDIDLL